MHFLYFFILFFNMKRKSCSVCPASTVHVLNENVFGILVVGRSKKPFDIFGLWPEDRILAQHSCSGLTRRFADVIYLNLEYHDGEGDENQSQCGLYLQIKQSSHESIINFLSCRVSGFLCFFCYVCVDARRKKATHVYVLTNFFFVLSLFGKFPKHEISQENAMNTRQDKKQKNQNELDTIGAPRPVLPCAHMATLRFVFSLFLFLIIVKKKRRTGKHATHSHKRKD